MIPWKRVVKSIDCWLELKYGLRTVMSFGFSNMESLLIYFGKKAGIGNLIEMVLQNVLNLENKMEIVIVYNSTENFS